MKKYPLLQRCFGVAAFLVSLLPLSATAAPGDLYVSDTGSNTIF